jgi:acetyl esterase/lipase
MMRIAKSFHVFLAALLLCPGFGFCQETMKLYLGTIPNSKGEPKPANKPSPGTVDHVTQPQLEIYLPGPGSATGAAVIICPGGSYKNLTYEAEGLRTAKEFQKNGVAAFVLQYRLPNDDIMTDKSIGPLQDAQQAIKVVHENAMKWNIDTARIGMMGFSAGGHLAATAATHFNHSYVENPSHTSLRPAFLILVYPVISMRDSLAHRPSRANLLGQTPSPENILLFSNELQADASTPPTYLMHAGDDKMVDVDNSIAFYEKLRHGGVPAEMHIYPKGGHGFVLKEPTSVWMSPLFGWMKTQKIIN